MRVSELLHVSHGVWRAPEAVDDLVGRSAALLDGCAPNTVIAGITAARLHGLWLPQLGDGDEPVDVIVHPEVRRPSARSSSRRAAVNARRRILAPADLTTLTGLPVTSEARTWFDLAAILQPPDLVAAGDSALRGDATLDELAAVVVRARNCPGVIRARAALPHLDARSRSRPESVLRFGLVSRGLPKPAVNRAVHNERGEWLGEPDLHYEDARLAIEYNGAVHAEVSRMRGDMTRGVDVIGGGWLLVTAGPTEVFRRIDAFAGVIARLRTERMRGASFGR